MFKRLQGRIIDKVIAKMANSYVSDDSAIVYFRLRRNTREDFGVFSGNVDLLTAIIATVIWNATINSTEFTIEDWITEIYTKLKNHQEGILDNVIGVSSETYLEVEDVDDEEEEDDD